MAMTGLPQAAGFHKTLGQMMYQYSVQPWDPKVLLQASLQRQQELQKSSPLRFIQVEDGLQFYGSQLGGVINTLTREKFVEMSQVLFRQKGLHLPVEEARLFYDIFDSIDLYKNATLSIGELAGGLSSFFGGTVEAKTSAVFELLAGGGEQVPKARLHELLKPYVWCMVPPHAEVLRPILLPHVAEEIYSDMTLSGSGYLTRAEMQRWAQRGTFAQTQAGPNAASHCPSQSLTEQRTQSVWHFKWLGRSTTASTSCESTVSRRGSRTTGTNHSNLTMLELGATLPRQVLSSLPTLPVRSQALAK